MLANFIQKASRMSGGFNSTIMSISCSQHSFTEHYSTLTLLGDGDADENKTNYLKGSYLPTSVCELKKRKETDETNNPLESICCWSLTPQ